MGLRNKRAPIVRIDGDMVFKGKIDVETRAYLRFWSNLRVCLPKNPDFREA